MTVRKKGRVMAVNLWHSFLAENESVHEESHHLQKLSVSTDSSKLPPTFAEGVADQRNAW